MPINQDILETQTEKFDTLHIKALQIPSLSRNKSEPDTVEYVQARRMAERIEELDRQSKTMARVGLLAIGLSDELIKTLKADVETLQNSIELIISAFEQGDPLVLASTIASATKLIGE